MQAKTLMKKFLIEKGLWDEFGRFYSEIMLEGIYQKKEKLPAVKYIPRTTKTQRKERDKRVVKMRKEGLTYREIGDKENISGQCAKNIVDAYTQ